MADAIGELGKADRDHADALDVADEGDEPEGGERLLLRDRAKSDGLRRQGVDVEDHRFFEIRDEGHEPAGFTGRERRSVRWHAIRFPDMLDREVHRAAVGHEHDPAPAADEGRGAREHLLDGVVDPDRRRGDRQPAQVRDVLFGVATADVHRRVAQQDEDLVEPVAGEAALAVGAIAVRTVGRFPDVEDDGARVERTMHAVHDARRDVGLQEIADPGRGRAVEQSAAAVDVQEELGGCVVEWRRVEGRSGRLRARQVLGQEFVPR